MMTLMTSHSFITLNKNSVWRFWTPDILRALTAEAEEIRHKKTKNINLLSMCTRTRVCVVSCVPLTLQITSAHTKTHTAVLCCVNERFRIRERGLEANTGLCHCVCVCVYR